MNIKKKLLIITILIAIAVTIGLTNSCTKNSKKDYNIVLIVIDTLRSDHLPMYGYHKNTAPFMTELAQRGVVFENAFSASSWTSPATASIFTSLYPYQHGVLMGLLAIRNAKKINPNLTINRIPEKIETITEVLKKEGYQTYGVADNLNIGKRQGFTQGFDKFRTFMYKQAPNVNETALKWKKKLMSNGKYFLYLHYMDPHAPYHPREPWYKKFEDRKENRISAYDSEINYVDGYIKKMYHEFQWDKNTVVIITSDHGEGLWDHGLMGHGKTLFREEIQVPLIIYLPETAWPEGTKKSNRVSTNVSTIDILPTVRALIGLDQDEKKEGVNLLPLIEGKETDLGKRDLFSYLWVQMKDTVEWRSTIYKKWHYLFKLPDGKHLYSLLKDKKEQDNKAHLAIDVLKELEKRFNDFMKNSKKYKQQTEKVKLDKKKTDQLKSLGYVN